MLNKFLQIAENASDHGHYIDSMLELIHWFMLILFIGWSCFFCYTLYRFSKKRNPKASYHGARSKASTHAEVGVVVVEAMLLLGFAIPIWGSRVNDFPEGDNVVRVRVVAEQFGFNIHYPGADGVFGRVDANLVSAANKIGLDREDEAAKDDIVTFNALHLPVGQPAILQLSSKDVIHNFALYTMRTAQDMIPGSEIPLWFTPIKTGEWEVICGQLCGNGHYAMKAMLTVEAASDFQNWLDGQAPAPAQ